MKLFYRLFKRLPTPIQWWAYHLANPHFLVGVVGILIRDEKVLIVKNSYRSGWSLPGGMLKKGEEATDCFIREVREELGVQVRNATVVTAVTVKPLLMEICCQAELGDQELALDEKELVSAQFVGPHELPSDLSPSSRNHLNRYFSLK